MTKTILWSLQSKLTTGNKRAGVFLRQDRGRALLWRTALLPSEVTFRFRPVAAYERELGRGRIAKIAREIGSLFGAKTG